MFQLFTVESSKLSLLKEIFSIEKFGLYATTFP